MQQEVIATLKSKALQPAEKDLEITRLLARQFDRGMGVVRAIALEDSSDYVTHLYNYLALVPGKSDLKTELVLQLLERAPERIDIAARCVRDLPWRAALHVVGVFLGGVPEHAMRGTLLELATHFPAMLQPYRDKLADKEFEVLLLPGADEEVLATLVAAYQKHGKLQLLQSIAFVRTREAKQFLAELRKRTKNPQLDAMLSLAGESPVDGASLVWFPVNKGFIAPANESPHAMPHADGELVPACDTCGTGATKLLSIDVSRLTLPLSTRETPTLYAYGCNHVGKPIYVQHVRGKTTGILAKMTGKAGPRFLSAPASLVLEPQPSEFGLGGWRRPGRGLHQVGGFPPLLSAQKNPLCPLCNKLMPFLASLDSGLSLLGPTSLEGVVYGYWCDGCAVSASLRQLG